MLKITPSRYTGRFAQQMLDDIDAFPSKIRDQHDGTLAEIMKCAESYDPLSWAHADTVDLFRCALAANLHASSLRMTRMIAAGFTREQAAICGLEILQWRIPATLRMITHELRQNQ